MSLHGCRLVRGMPYSFYRAHLNPLGRHDSVGIQFWRGRQREKRVAARDTHRE